MEKDEYQDALTILDQYRTNKLYMGKYQHNKYKTIYQVVSFCLREYDLAVCVLYQQVEAISRDFMWCRPVTEFYNNDRFTKLVEDL